ncbi:MAG: amidohydrolase family protein [Dehalococcoidia bacterium]
MITDAQVHLWEASRPDRPWDPDAKPHLPDPVPAERMVAWMDEAGIDRAVISPLYLPGNGPEYACEVAARYPDRFRVMGWYQPADPSHLANLERWLDQPGMCSLRLSLNEPVGSRLLAEGTLEPFWSTVERLKLPVAVFRVDGIAEVMEPILDRYPTLRLIVDHLNMPVTPDVREARMSSLVRLARFPEVTVKVSALPRFSTEPPPFVDLQPMIQQVYQAFGARRMLWGSDQTQLVARGVCSYRQNLDVVLTEAARWMPAEDVAWVTGKTAASVFNWPER